MKKLEVIIAASKVDAAMHALAALGAESMVTSDISSPPPPQQRAETTTITVGGFVVDKEEELVGPHMD